MHVGERYWDYFLIHVDYFLVDYWRDKAITKSIGKVYLLKEYKYTIVGYQPPDVYIGTNIRFWCHKDTGKEEPCFWSMYGDHYAKKIATNVQPKLVPHVRKLNVN